MAHFLVEYSDIGTAEARAQHRGEHVAYRKGIGDALRLAGPILDDAGSRYWKPRHSGSGGSRRSRATGDA